MFKDYQSIHVGEKIQELLDKKGWTKKALGDNLGMTPSNAVYLTKRPSIDVVTLHKIGMVMAYNFWQHYPIEKDYAQTVEWLTGKDKVIEEQKQKIAALELEMEKLKMKMEAVQSENGVMRDVIAVLKRK